MWNLSILLIVLRLSTSSIVAAQSTPVTACRCLAPWEKLYPIVQNRRLRRMYPYNYENTYLDSDGRYVVEGIKVLANTDRGCRPRDQQTRKRYPHNYQNYNVDAVQNKKDFKQPTMAPAEGTITFKRDEKHFFKNMKVGDRTLQTNHLEKFEEAGETDYNDVWKTEFRGIRHSVPHRNLWQTQHQTDDDGWYYTTEVFNCPGSAPTVSPAPSIAGTITPVPTSALMTMTPTKTPAPSASMRPTPVETKLQTMVPTSLLMTPPPTSSVNATHVPTPSISQAPSGIPTSSPTVPSVSLMPSRTHKPIINGTSAPSQHPTSVGSSPPTGLPIGSVVPGSSPPNSHSCADSNKPGTECKCQTSSKCSSYCHQPSSNFE